MARQPASFDAGEARFTKFEWRSPGLRFPNSDCDGFSEQWFDSEEALVAALQGPEGRSLLADLPNFAQDVSPILSVETQIFWP